jgi:hypothetical protein
LLVAVLLCSSAIADPLRPQLPAEVTMNKDAGRGNWLIVTLRLDSGQELPFVVDTGCPKTILDKSLEPELGKQLGVITIWTLGGKRRAGLYAAPKLYLESAPLTIDSNIITCDLKKITSHAHHSVMGFLGMDCLKNYCIQLDFESGKIRLLDPDHMSAAGLGKAFPLEFFTGPGDHGFQPFISHVGLLGGKSTNTIIDTGMNSDGAVERSMIQVHSSGSYSGNFLKRIKHFAAVEGLVNRGVDLPECVWDGNTYTNISVGGAPSDAPSWIGLRFLARHLVTFNFPKAVMYLKRTNIGHLINETQRQRQTDQNGCVIDKHPGP